MGTEEPKQVKNKKKPTATNTIEAKNGGKQKNFPSIKHREEKAGSTSHVRGDRKKNRGGSIGGTNSNGVPNTGGGCDQGPIKLNVDLIKNEGPSS